MSSSIVAVRHARRAAATLLATTMLAGFAAPAQAQAVLDWNGSQSSDWQDGANWDQNRVPATNDVISIQNDSTNSSVSTQSGDNAINRLLVGSEAGARSQLYINGSLFFAGGGAVAPDIIGGGGGSGRVDVRGFWRSAGMIVGAGAGSKGTLVIQGVNGGTARLEAGYITLGANGGTGALAISGSGALTGGVVAGVNGGRGSIDVSDHSGWQASYIDLINGIAVFSGASVLDTKDIRVGFSGGTGDFDIRSGSVVNAQNLSLGGYSAANGANASSGIGTLELSGAATLFTTGATSIATGVGSTGKVTINASAWHSSAGLTIGRAGGVGSIGIDNGGSVDDATSIMIGTGLGSQGTVTVNDSSAFGTGGRMSIGANGGTGDVTFSGFSTGSSNARLAVGGTADLDIVTMTYIPTSGTGALRLFNGSSFSANPNAFGEFNSVGVGTGSTGEIFLSAGSFLNLQGDSVVGGFAGTGTIRAEIASNAVFDRLTLGTDTVSRGGLTLDGSTGRINQDLAIGYGGGLGQVQLSNQSTLYVGGNTDIGVNGGSGLMLVLGGSVFTGNGPLTVASGTGGVGNLGVDGATTGWQQTGRITVGTARGVGQIDLTAAASGLINLGGTSLTLGDTGGQGVLHVDGVGTNLTQSNGNVVLGITGGTGSLSARNGGTFLGTGPLTAGSGLGSTGTLAAIGAQSSVAITGSASFGSNAGSGYVTARDGGLVELGGDDATILFGQGAGSTGGFNVDGGGKLNLRGTVVVGGATGEANAFGSIGGAGSQLSTLGGSFGLTNGKVEVSDGGILLTGQGASIGGTGTTPALLRLSGRGSSWIAASDTYIGGQLNAAGNAVTPGTGSVYLLGGATLGGANARLGVASMGGTGALLIDMDSRANAGDYTQGTGGTLVIGIDPNIVGRAGLLSSDGNAVTLANGTHIAIMKQVAGQYQFGARYELIRSINAPITRGTINFDGLDQQSLFVGLVPTFQALGQGEILYLDVAQIRSFASVATTPNQAAAAGGADSLASTNALKGAILGLQTEDQVRGAFDALSGEIYPGIRTALIEDSRLPRLAVLDRLSEAQGGAGAWMQAIGNWGETGGDSNAATLRRDTKGVIIGLDLPLGDSGLRAGLAGGYADGNITVDRRASRADLTSYHALAYLGGTLGRVELRVGAGFSWSKVDATRIVTFPGFSDAPRARFDARTIQGFGEVGYRLPMGGGWVEPFAGYSAVRVRSDGFREAGGLAALTVGRSNQTATASTLGLKGSTAATGPIVAGFTIGWQHRLDTLTPSSTMNLADGTPFSIAGVGLAKDQAVADLSVGWRLPPGTVVAVRYTGAIGGRVNDNAVKASLSLMF